ncbi:hypothetical protein MLD38_025318 [Melastoma candidum]|uniref:Uncharacterized protein n=1 Tax=Melastoma candidum TaxID=119954 RepID=A0ACB9NY37_9MYRT|nr:hypothetical protein MLD38_025318 [Melastoma candidum]
MGQKAISTAPVNIFPPKWPTGGRVVEGFGRGQNSGGQKALSYQAPHRRLSAAEMEEKRQKGLCFWCDDKYSMSHKCTNRRMYSITLEADDHEGVVDQLEPAEDELATEDSPIVSLHALHGVALSFKNRTMKVIGLYKKRKLTILVDSGSTHNFLDAEIARQLGGVIQIVASKSVMVANGERLFCNSMLKAFRWSMQGEEYEADMLIMPMKGCEVILGMEWLNSLGRVMWDFPSLTMQYQKNGKTQRNGADVNSNIDRGTRVA